MASFFICLTGYKYGKEQGYEEGFHDGYEAAEEHWKMEEDFLNKADRDMLMLMNMGSDKKTTIISAISILVSIVVFYFFFNPHTISFFIAVSSLLFASGGLAVYYITVRKKLYKSERIEIVLCITIWMLIFYGLVHYHSLPVFLSFLGRANHPLL